MKIAIKELLPKFEFAVCASCGELFGYTPDEIDTFQGKRSNGKQILTIICPFCNEMLILPPPPKEQDEKVIIEMDAHDIDFDLLFDDYTEGEEDYE